MRFLCAQSWRRAPRCKAGKHPRRFLRRGDLLDWGVAKVWANDDPELKEMEHEVLTDPGQRPGTPLYMSPEQIRGGGDSIDARTDVYGIGAVLYEVLTLKEPHRGETDQRNF